MEKLGSIFNTFYEDNILTYINMYQEHPIKLISLIIDIFLVICLIYLFVRMVKGTRTWQLVKGIAFLIITTWLSDILGLSILHYILSAIMNWGVILIIVIAGYFYIKYLLTHVFYKICIKLLNLMSI